MSQFFKYFMIVATCTLFMVLSINYVVDPYSIRGQRLKGINERVVPSAALTKYISDVYKANNKGDAVKYSFVGTSHVGSGIDEKKNYFLEKIATNSMSIYESEWVLRKILEESNMSKTIFIEVCSKSDHDRPIHPEVFQNLVSLRNFVLSLKTVLHNQAPERFPFLPKEEQQLVSDTVKSLSVLTSEKTLLRTMTTQEINIFNAIRAGKIETKARLKHEIVFFIPPLPHETMTMNNRSEFYNPLVAQLEKIFNTSVPSQNNLKFSFVNLLDKNIGKNYQFKNSNFSIGWYDSTHFTPAIGDEVISYLIDYVKK